MASHKYFPVGPHSQSGLATLHAYVIDASGEGGEPDIPVYWGWKDSLTCMSDCAHNKFGATMSHI
eukprot:6189504-Alexandrium_andersonii.AAC.1